LAQYEAASSSLPTNPCKDTSTLDFDVTYSQASAVQAAATSHWCKEFVCELRMCPPRNPSIFQLQFHINCCEVKPSNEAVAVLAIIGAAAAHIALHLFGA